MFIYRLFQSGYSTQEIVLLLLIYFLVLSLAFSFHEYMHAVTAFKLGDDTPYNAGRVTLNPMAHIDIMGMIMLVIMGFGWGRPVTWNPNRVTKCKIRTAEVLVSLAGVTGNFVLAIIGKIISVIVLSIIPETVSWYYLIQMFFSMFVEVNLTLLAFNLIPIPPLDGFMFIDALLPVRAKYTNFYKKLVRYAPTVLFALILIGSFANISVLSWLITLIEIPFAFVVGIIGGLVQVLMNMIMK